MSNTNSPVVFEDSEAAVVEYAVEQYISKIQERIANEHSGINRFMLDSNLIYANNVLAKVRASQPQPEPYLAPAPAPEG